MSVKNTLTFFLLIYLEPVPEKTLPIFNSPPLHLQFTQSLEQYFLRALRYLQMTETAIFL